MNILQKLHIVLTIVLALSLLVVIKCGLAKEKTNNAHASNVDSVDTVFDYKIDTIVEYKIAYKEKIVKDTIYLDAEKEPFLLLVQKQFSSFGKYDIWVSGVEPLTVDSAHVYPRTEYRYITQTKTIHDNNGVDVFLMGGFNRFNGLYSPKVSVCTSVNRKWLYEAEIGLIGDSWYGGVKIGFKINNK